MKKIPRFYFSRRPGNFVNEHTGKPLKKQPKFDGTVREWYEKLMDFVKVKACQVLGKRTDGFFEAHSPSQIMTIFESTRQYQMYGFCHNLYSTGYIKGSNILFFHCDVPRNEIHIHGFYESRRQPNKIIIEITDMDII
jgi:hypothetical protein